MIYTTLSKIRAHRPCTDGWRKLLAHLGKTTADDAPLPISVVLDSNGLDDALWTIRTAPEYATVWRKFAVWCASRVAHLCQDGRANNALRVAWAHADGMATDGALLTERGAAWSAAWSAAWGATRGAAEDAARDAARGAAWDAARAEQSNTLSKLLAHPEAADNILMDDTLRRILRGQM